MDTLFDLETRTFISISGNVTTYRYGNLVDHHEISERFEVDFDTCVEEFQDYVDRHVEVTSEDHTYHMVHSDIETTYKGKHHEDGLRSMSFLNVELQNQYGSILEQDAYIN